MSIFTAVRAFLRRRRVTLSLAIFAGLIAEDVLLGIEPHALFSFYDWHSSSGLLLVLLGLVLRSWAAGTLHKTTELTTVGPYRLVRNPLYVGSFMMMVGFCLLIDDPENIWFVGGPLAAIYFFTVRNEEAKLKKKFGLAWSDYAQQTPRFFPRSLPTPGRGEWRFSQWMKNREYQAALGTLLGLIALQLWHNAVHSHG